MTSNKSFKEISKEAFSQAYAPDMKGFQSHKGLQLSRLKKAGLSEAQRELVKQTLTSAEYVGQKSKGAFRHEGHSYKWNSPVKSYEVGFGATKAYVTMGKCRSNALLTGDNFKTETGQTLKVRFESPYLFDTVARLWCKTFGVSLKDLKKSLDIVSLDEIEPQEAAGMVDDMANVPAEINGVSVPMPRFNQAYMKALQGRLNRGLFVPQVDRTVQGRVNKLAALTDSEPFSLETEEVPSWALMAKPEPKPVEVVGLDNFKKQKGDGPSLSDYRALGDLMKEA